MIPHDLAARPGTGPRREARGRRFAVLCGLATAVGVLALLVLLEDILLDGLGVLDTQFLTGFASRSPERAGIRAALAGSAWILGLTVAIAFPVALGAAIYLEEYAPRGRLTQLVQANIANLAGVPSIVYGIVGLTVFVRWAGLGRSLLSGALTLTILILPVLVISAQEAIRSVPRELREAAYGLGATRWQVVRHQVLPRAFPGVLTGAILALSRAAGETAPLILVGAVGFIAFTPRGPMDEFTVLPLQIYDWISRPQSEFHALAAGGIIVLLALLLAMNAAAIILRNRYRDRR